MAMERFIQLITKILRQPILLKSDRALFCRFQSVFEGRMDDSDLVNAASAFLNYFTAKVRNFDGNSPVFVVRDANLLELWKRLWTLIEAQVLQQTSKAVSYGGCGTVSDYVLLQISLNMANPIHSSASIGSPNGLQATNVVYNDHAAFSDSGETLTSFCDIDGIFRITIPSALEERYRVQAKFCIAKMRRRLCVAEWRENRDRSGCVLRIMKQLARYAKDGERNWKLKVVSQLDLLLYFMDSRAAALYTADSKFENMQSDLAADFAFVDGAHVLLNTGQLRSHALDVQVFIRLLIQVMALSMWKMLLLKYRVSDRGLLDSVSFRIGQRLSDLSNR